MYLNQLLGMFNRAKILLGARRHFCNEGEQPVGIGAVDATDLLDRIQISESSPVKHEVVFPSNLWDSVDWKADRLIERNRGVEKQKGKHASVDDWR